MPARSPTPRPFLRPEPRAGPGTLLEQTLQRVREREELGDLTEARKAIDAAPEAARSLATWHYVSGALALRARDFSAAVDAFQEAMTREPDVPEVAASLGAALLERSRLGGGGKADLARSLDILRQAARGSPRLSCAHNNLGLALLEAGELEQALETFEQARALAPADPTVLYNRAAALRKLGRKKECLTALDEVLALQPSFAPARESRARMVRKKG